MKRALGLLSLVALSQATSATAPIPAGAAPLRHSTPAVSDYDVVSYHSGEKPQRGNGNHVAVHDGATYLFVDEENRRAFERDPERYLPAYGGYCAYGVAVGKKFVGDPDVWRVVGGRLYLTSTRRSRRSGPRTCRSHIRKADGNWRRIREESGLELTEGRESGPGEDS